MLVVVFEVLIEVAWFTRITAASSFIKLPCLMVNTEEPVWKDKGQRSLFHQHLLSELSADGKNPPLCFISLQSLRDNITGTTRKIRISCKRFFIQAIQIKR